ncbi:hypothetical protein [Spirosoma sp. KNUC1025]|uniref:hypothetical protein n=1 Tax=Spirosoma sp. KNUC1025 TaxID=2894082 RepID=UPI0038700DF0|nr:hypothetical protein LN737_19805 [Spirosoma sp. KNUC1025]
MSNRSWLVVCMPVLAGLSGCATLTPSQVAAINQYADVTTHYSDYPSKVLAEFLVLRYKDRTLIASQNSDKENPLTFKDISKLYAQKKGESEAIQGLDIGIQTITDYATALKKLSSPDFARDVGANAQTLGTSLDSLTSRYNTVVKPNVGLPFIGSIVGLTLREVGGRYVGYKQTAALKRYVQAGDTLINILTKSMEEMMATHTATYIQELEKDVQTFNNQLLVQLSDKTQYERYQFASETLALVEQIDHLKKMNGQSILALQKLRSAHNELTDQLRQKQKLISVGKEMFGLYQAVRDLQSTYQQISH